MGYGQKFVSWLGSLTETAPANDTASSGLNGRLQRIAQRITSAIALLTGPTTGAITSVNDTASDVSILASNASRKGATIFNDSTVILYLALANVTATTSVYSVQVPPGGYYELPVNQGGVYTGVIKGIWASDASGAARVTELT